jgi:hypothetical protein
MSRRDVEHIMKFLPKKHNYLLTKPQQKWNLELELDSVNSSDMWKFAYKVPIDSNLKYFQFRILHRILTTNRYLKLINITDNDLCTFCNEEVESIVHLMFACKHVETVWQRLSNWFVKNGHLQLDHLEKKDIILGIQDQDIVINQIIIITKLVIYRSKLNNKLPTIQWSKHILNI